MSLGLCILPIVLLLFPGENHSLALNWRKQQLGFPLIAVCSDLELKGGFSLGKEQVHGEIAQTCASLIFSSSLQLPSQIGHAGCEIQRKSYFENLQS